MSTHITRNNVSASSDPDSFIAEASELRWPVGHVPRVLTTDLGNGGELLLVSCDEDQFEYRQKHGRVSLTVFND